MAATAKFLKLIDTLIQRTRGGTANWSQASYEDTFLWSTTSGSVSVFPTDHDDAPPWTVRILGGEGQILEEEVFRHDDPGFEQAAELYTLARGNALDIDATIDKLLEDLG